MAYLSVIIVTIGYALTQSIYFLEPTKTICKTWSGRIGAMEGYYTEKEMAMQN